MQDLAAVEARGPGHGGISGWIADAADADE
jgi:hypothetical protein